MCTMRVVCPCLTAVRALRLIASEPEEKLAGTQDAEQAAKCVCVCVCVCVCAAVGVTGYEGSNRDVSRAVL
jgi:hypothetical protein